MPVRNPTFQLVLLAALCASGAPALAQQATDEGPVIVGQSKSKWKTFDLNRVDGALELLGRHRMDRLRQTAADDTTDRESLMRELLELSGEAYLGHKNLVDLTGKVRFGLEQRFLDYETVAESDKSADFTNLFDLNAHVLGTSKLPTDIYARRDEQFLDRDFAGSVKNTTEEYGAAVSYQSSVAPTTVRVFQLKTKQDDPLGQFDYDITQRTFSLNSNIRLGNGHRLEAAYTFDDVEENQIGGFSNDYQRHDAQLTDVINFGKDRASELRSYLRLYDQSGQFDQRIFRWDEQLLLVHTNRLETRYNTTVERQEIGDSQQDRLDASALVKHRLFDSLTSTGTVGVRKFSDSSDFDSNEWYVQGDWDYTKKVPLGRLDINLGASFNAQDNSERGGTFRILDESHVYNDPLPITLSRARIVFGSLVVTAASGFPTYQEGTHYTVQYFVDRVEIRIIVGSGISNGDTLLFDYDVGPEPGNSVNTTSISAAIRYTIDKGVFNGLSLYTQYRRQDHSVDAVDPTQLFYDDSETLQYGAEYRRGGWHFRAEQERHESTITPYDKTLLEASYNYVFSRGSTLGIDATREVIDYENPANELIFNRLSFRWNEQLTSNTNMLFRVDFRDEDDDLRGSTQGIDQYLTLQWWKRQTTAYITLRNTLLETDSTDRTTHFVEIGIRREF